MQAILREINQHQNVIQIVLENLQSYIYTAKIILQQAIENNKKFIFWKWRKCFSSKSHGVSTE